jgi:hypothetical protein
MVFKLDQSEVQGSKKDTYDSRSFVPEETKLKKTGHKSGQQENDRRPTADQDYLVQISGLLYYRPIFWPVLLVFRSNSDESCPLLLPPALCHRARSPVSPDSSF